MTTPTQATVTGAVLTEQYRQAQVQLSARTMRDMIAIWPLLLERTDPAERQWLTLALGVVRRDRAQSARYAADYLAAYRYIELGSRRPDGGFTPRPMGQVPIEQVTTSLISSGPKALSARHRAFRESQGEPETLQPKRELHPESAPVRAVRDGVARAAQRHVVNGGRDTIDNVIENDPEVQGYIRITDGDPCFFCAVLASRGPVYVEESFDESDPRFHGPGNAKVHDGCGCTSVPVYDRKSPLLDRNRDFEKQWYDLSRKLGRVPNLLDFRRMYEGRQPRKRS